MAIGDLIKSTLGPKGMDKILWGMGRNDGTIEVTNDGATILRSVGVDNPAAKVLVEMSRVQVRSISLLNLIVIIYFLNWPLFLPSLAYLLFFEFLFDLVLYFFY